VIAAAGSGERLGAGGPKAFVEVAGRPLLAWSLAAFDAAASVGAIVVVAPPGEEKRIGDLAAEAGIEGIVAPGGEHRSKSVANGLLHVDTELVVVHDAARPLVAPTLIDEVVMRLQGDGGVAGVIAAAPVADTIKEASLSRRVLRTPERSRLWGAQTPQVFRTGILRQALSAHAGELEFATDDASLVERFGGEVLIHEAPQQTIKVTTPRVLRVAELLLAGRSSTELD
jgi:2-C-methyl-D-erythritol 4-phosphate cytidylyltransferase